MGAFCLSEGVVLRVPPFPPAKTQMESGTEECEGERCCCGAGADPSIYLTIRRVVEVRPGADDILGQSV